MTSGGVVIPYYRCHPRESGDLNPGIVSLLIDVYANGKMNLDGKEAASFKLLSLPSNVLLPCRFS